MKISFLTSAMLLLVMAAVSPAQEQKTKASIAGLVTQLVTGSPVVGARVTVTRAARGPAAGPGLPAPSVQIEGFGGAAVSTTQGPDERRLEVIGAVSPRVPPLPPIPAVSTDENGRFLVTDLGEGAYTLQVQANGYVAQNYGQRSGGGVGKAITLTAGQEMSGVALTLTPAGNVSGRVVDQADLPLINVPVRLYKYTYRADGKKTYESVGNATTSDRGEYRIYWLTPGRYYAMAGNTSTGGLTEAALFLGLTAAVNPNVIPILLNYSIYPGVTDIAAARPLELQPGADLDGINFKLARQPATYRLRVRVIDGRTGQPPARASLSLWPQAMGESGTQESLFYADIPRDYNATTGITEFKGLLPGLYRVTVTSEDPRTPIPAGGRGASPGPRPEPVRSTGTTTVVLSDKDVDGITITTLPSVTVPGRIRVDGQLLPPLALERLRIALQPISRISGNGSAVNPAADGSFKLTNVAAGDYRLAVLAQGRPNAAGGGSVSLYIKDARFEGADALNLPMRVAGLVAGSLDILVGLGGGQVNGVVADERAGPVPVTQVVLIPDRRDREDLYRTVFSDDNGRFVFSGIPPGEYKVFSWDAVEANGWFDPDFLERHESKGRAVHVTESATENVDVKIIAAGGSQ